MKGGNLERLCVACRKLRPKDQMIRFVRTGGNVTADFSGKIQSRGAYVCRDLDCLKRAAEKDLLRRALHAPGSGEAVQEAIRAVSAMAGEVPVE